MLLYKRLPASPQSELERLHAGTSTLDALPAFEFLGCLLDDLRIPDIELAGSTTELYQLRHGLITKLLKANFASARVDGGFEPVDRGLALLDAHDRLLPPYTTGASHH